MPCSEDEEFYGFGLQLKSLACTGRKRALRVNSDPREDLGDSHAPAPLFFSTRGYGVMIDTARYMNAYMGGNLPLAGKSAKTAEEKTTIPNLHSTNGICPKEVTPALNSLFIKIEIPRCLMKNTEGFYYKCPNVLIREHLLLSKQR